MRLVFYERAPIRSELSYFFQKKPLIQTQTLSNNLRELEPVNYPPKISVSKLVNSVKELSSRMIRKKKYPSMQKSLWGGSLWSPSYFAGSCGGVPIEVVRQHIEDQKTPH